MIDFKNFKINCSQIGSLMGNARGGTKPPSETEIKKLFGILGRDYGELTEPMKHSAREILTKAILYDPKKPSATILNELILIYAYQVYGKGKVSMGNDSPHQLEKGTMAEPEAIKFLSKMDGIEYEKNDELFENKWFKGIPDIIIRDEASKTSKIIEVKTSYDLPSFILSRMKPEKASNLFEVMGYMNITGCKNAEIVHVLVDMPEKIANFEEKRLRERYEAFQLDQEIIEDRISSRMNDMDYSDIPEKMKIFRRSVTLNRFAMKPAQLIATAAKRWLLDIHNTLTENIVVLPETEENKPEEDNT